MGLEYVHWLIWAEGRYKYVHGVFGYMGVWGVCGFEDFLCRVFWIFAIWSQRDPVPFIWTEVEVLEVSF